MLIHVKFFYFLELTLDNDVNNKQQGKKQHAFLEEMCAQTLVTDSLGAFAFLLPRVTADKSFHI